MLSDHYHWPTYVEEHGRFLDSGTLYPVPIRIGIIKGDQDEYAIAISVNDEETAAITTDVAARLRQHLRSVSDEYNALIKQRDEKHQHAARRLIDTAVLTPGQWREIIAAIARRRPRKTRASGPGAAGACAPPSWVADLDARGADARPERQR